MTFSDPRWLWALGSLPVLALLEAWAWRRTRARLERIVGEAAPHPLLVGRQPGERLVGTVLRIAALMLLIVGAAGPEWGREVVRRGSTGSDVLLMIDVSASMDSRDVPP